MTSKAPVGKRASMKMASASAGKAAGKAAIMSLSSLRHRGFDAVAHREYFGEQGIRRLGRAAGIKHFSGDIYGAVRVKAETFLKRVVRLALVRCEYAERKTLNYRDLCFAMESVGKTLA